MANKNVVPPINPNQSRNRRRRGGRKERNRVARKDGGSKESEQSSAPSVPHPSPFSCQPPVHPSRPPCIAFSLLTHCITYSFLLSLINFFFFLQPNGDASSCSVYIASGSRIYKLRVSPYYQYLSTLFPNQS